MRFVAFLLASCVSLLAQEASIEGFAVNTATGMPMPGVQIKLFTGLLNDNSSPTHAVYGAKTDSTGHFSISTVKPGTYFYLGQFAGFVTIRKDPGNVPFPNVTIKSGDRLAAFKVELTPEAVLAGRVIDEFGDAARGFAVQARLATPSDATAYTPLYNSTLSDDRGEFRIPIAPGRYLVKASPPNVPYQRTEQRKDGSSPPSYAATYFPNAVSSDRATVVEAAAGSTVNGLDIRLASQHSISITGAVTGIPAGTLCYVTIRYGEKETMLNEYKNAYCDQDGHFTFPAIHAPFIVAYAATNNGVHYQSRILELKAADTDVSGITLALMPPAEITGTVLFSGETTGASRTVTLQPSVTARYLISGVSAESNAQGAFRLANVFPAAYKVQVQPLPANAYVATLDLDGAQIPGDDLDLAHIAAGSKLKIVLSHDGGEITGSLQDKDGQPVRDSVSIVALFQGHLTSVDPIKADPDGAFRIHGIRPGKYKILAIDAIRSSGLNSPDVLSQLEASAQEIEIQPSAHLTLDLKIAHVK